MKKVSILLLACSALLTSCISSFIYEPGSVGRVQTPVLPRAYDENDNGHWQLAGYGLYGSETHLAGDTTEFVDMIMGVAQYHHRTKVLDFFGGVHAFSGNYKNANQHFDVFDQKTPFYGVGFRGGTNINVDFGKFTFRPLGIQFLYTYEFGPYNDALKKLENQSQRVDTLGSPFLIYDVAVYSKNSVITLGFPLLQFGGPINSDWYLSGGFAIDYTAMGNAEFAGVKFEQSRFKMFLAASYRNFSLVWNPIFAGQSYEESINGAVNSSQQQTELGRLGLQVQF